MSRRSHNSSARVLVAAPMRWRRSSGWSPTTWLGTRLAKGSGCPERLFPRSPKFGSRNPHTETALFAPAMTAHHRNVGSGNHPAIAGGLGTPDMPPRCRSSPPTPLNSGGILPSCTHTTYWGYLSKADTHLLRNQYRADIGGDCCVRDVLHKPLPDAPSGRVAGSSNGNFSLREINP